VIGLVRAGFYHASADDPQSSFLLALFMAAFASSVGGNASFPETGAAGARANVRCPLCATRSAGADGRQLAMRSGDGTTKIAGGN